MQRESDRMFIPFLIRNCSCHISNDVSRLHKKLTECDLAFVTHSSIIACAIFLMQATSMTLQATVADLGGGVQMNPPFCPAL